MAVCPMCAEEANDERVCPHCGSVLRVDPQSNRVPAMTGTRPMSAASPPRTAGQWVIPGALTAAVVLALVVKFAWWDRRWQGTREACEVALALVGPEATPEERSDATRDYFRGSDQAQEDFGAGLAGAVMEFANDGTLSQRGVPVTSVDRAYVTAIRQSGVPEAEVRATAQSQRVAIVRSVGSMLSRHTTNEALAGLRAFASRCRTQPLPAPSQTPAAPTNSPSVRAAVPTPSPSLPPPAPVAAPAPAPTPAPATATATELQRLTPTTFSASSFISNGRNQYAPERAFDGDPATTWTEAARGPGDGEWLQATFAGPQLVQRVRISTGWNHTSPRGEDLFTANSHLRRVRLVLGPNTTIERDVGADEREVVFDGLDAETATVRIEAVSVWPGTRWADLCVGDLVIEGEPLANGPVAVPPADEAPPATGDDSRSCTYATHETFHLRANPTVSRAGAEEITTNPVVELLHAEDVRRRRQRLFRVRLPDGREGWMFVPDAEIPAGCER